MCFAPSYIQKNGSSTISMKPSGNHRDVFGGPD
jgi:hypothetical protein